MLRQAIEQQGMTGRLYETRAISLWPAIAGQEIASQCGRPFVYNGIMTISVRNASLRQELNMNRSILARIVNESLGREVINDMRFK